MLGARVARALPEGGDVDARGRASSFRLVICTGSWECVGSEPAAERQVLPPVADDARRARCLKGATLTPGGGLRASFLVAGSCSARGSMSWSRCVGLVGDPRDRSWSLRVCG